MAAPHTRDPATAITTVSVNASTTTAAVSTGSAISTRAP